MPPVLCVVVLIEMNESKRGFDRFVGPVSPLPAQVLRLCTKGHHRKAECRHRLYVVN